MKKFFAIALAFVMFAAVNMFANENNAPVSDECDVNVTVLKQITISEPADLAFTVVNDNDWTPGNEDAVEIAWTITGSQGYEIQWTITPDLGGGTGEPTIVFDKTGAALTGNVILGGATAEEAAATDGTANVSLSVTEIECAGATAGSYSFTQELEAHYVL